MGGSPQGVPALCPKWQRGGHEGSKPGGGTGPDGDAGARVGSGDTPHPEVPIWGPGCCFGGWGGGAQVLLGGGEPNLGSRARFWGPEHRFGAAGTILGTVLGFQAPP